MFIDEDPTTVAKFKEALDEFSEVIAYTTVDFTQRG